MRTGLSWFLACLAPIAAQGTTLKEPASNTGITIKIAEPVEEVIKGVKYAKFAITIINTTEKAAWIGVWKDVEADKLALERNPQSITYTIWHGHTYGQITEVLYRGGAGWESAVALDSDFIGTPKFSYQAFEAGASMEFEVMMDHHQFSQPGVMYFKFHFSWEESGRGAFHQVSQFLNSPNMFDIAPKERGAHLAWAKKAPTPAERLKRLESYWEKYWVRASDHGGWTDEQEHALCDCAWELAGCYIGAGHKSQALQLLRWLRENDSKSKDESARTLKTE